MLSTFFPNQYDGNIFISRIPPNQLGSNATNYIRWHNYYCGSQAGPTTYVGGFFLVFFGGRGRGISNKLENDK